jgi:hypothetical protein
MTIPDDSLELEDTRGKKRLEEFVVVVWDPRLAKEEQIGEQAAGGGGKE